jgi:hypothetical protein
MRIRGSGDALCDGDEPEDHRKHHDAEQLNNKLIYVHRDFFVFQLNTEHTLADSGSGSARAEQTLAVENCQ